MTKTRSPKLPKDLLGVGFGDDDTTEEDDLEDFTGLEDARARVLYYCDEKPTLDGDFWHWGKKGEPVEW